MNPRRRRRRHKRARSSRRGFFTASPRRRRRRRARSFFGNPRRRRYRARRRGYSRYHRNPPPRVQTIANELGWAAVGFMTTKVVGNATAPMVAGLGGGQPVIRIGLKFLVAYISAWGLSNFMGARVFMPAMIGGSIEAIQDAVKTFIAPTFPMLAANYEPMELYYEPRMLQQRGMSEYYMGDGLSPDHDVIV